MHTGGGKLDNQTPGYSLPEPLKSIASNLDPEFLQKLLTQYDPAVLSAMIGSFFTLLKGSLTEEQSKSLQDMLENLLKAIPKNKK